MPDDAPNSSVFSAVPVSHRSTSDEAARLARRLWGGPRRSAEVRDVRLRRLAEVIERNPDDWPAIRRGIEATQLSSAYLSVRFREALDMPMRSFALWMKFEHACQLVLEGTSPGDASLEAGFADQSHMGRAARRFAGKSFRRALHELQAGLDTSVVDDEANEKRPGDGAIGSGADGPSQSPSGVHPVASLRFAV